MKTILEKIQENAAACGEQDAYRLYVRPPYAGGRHTYSTLTWRELDILSGKLAARLCRDCRTNTPVVVYGHKDPLMLVCFLACVKSGRAYCPVDVSVPLNRVEAIIDAVKPELVLAVEPLKTSGGTLVMDRAGILAALEQETGTAAPERYVSADDVFYIIFTSGSTGTPKGVQITRDCLDHFIQWGITLGRGLDDGKRRVFLNQAPFSFDLSVMDLYLSLYTGGCLFALSKEVQGDMNTLLSALEQSGAEVWVSTPSFADMCLADKKFCDALASRLSLFLFCGETLTNRTADRLAAAFPKADIVNTYGPTESTVAVTQVRITPELRLETPLPVGEEKPGTWIFIQDEEGRDLPDGTVGEIVIAGDSVSTGYWKRPDLTERAFGARIVEGVRYRTYRTGDSGMKRNGQLYYQGRMDFQIKLHGYRIELGDIEGNLLKLEGVTAAAVLPVMREGKVRSLTAYVVAERHSSDNFAEGQRLRGDLRALVPEYMIPKKFVFLDRLPMTNNGKVDRRALGGNKK